VLGVLKDQGVDWESLLEGIAKESQLLFEAYANKAPSSPRQTGDGDGMSIQNFAPVQPVRGGLKDSRDQSKVILYEKKNKKTKQKAKTFSALI